MTAYTINTGATVRFDSLTAPSAVATLDSRMCVYAITHVETGRRYVGQTRGMAKDRWKSHRCFKSGNGCSAMKAAIKKYGASAFSFSVIDVASDPADLDSKEIEWIARLNTLAPHGFNIEAGGNGAGKVSEETKAKLRAAALAAYDRDPSLKARCAAPHLGRKHSAEERRKRSDSVKLAHRSNPKLAEMKSSRAKGVARSAETKEKIRAALLGRPHSEQRKAAIRDGMRKTG